MKVSIKQETLDKLENYINKNDLEYITHFHLKVVNSKITCSDIQFKSKPSNHSKIRIMSEVEKFLYHEKLLNNIQLNNFIDIYISLDYKAIYGFYNYDIKTLKDITNNIDENESLIIYLEDEADSNKIYINPNYHQKSDLLNITDYLFHIIDENIEIITIQSKNKKEFLQSNHLPLEIKLLLVKKIKDEIKIINSNQSILLKSISSIKTLI